MNHREMKALGENPDAVRALAVYLLNLPAIDAQVRWTDWELDFLEHMLRREGGEPLSMRQVEVLADLKEGARSYDKLDGLAVGSLIDDCWLARYDLDEDEERFIDTLKASGARALKKRQAVKLLGLARQLGVVAGFVAVD